MSSKRDVFRAAMIDRDLAATLAARMIERFVARCAPGLLDAMRGANPHASLRSCAKGLREREDRGDRAAREGDAADLDQLAEAFERHRLGWKAIDAKMNSRLGAS